MCVLEIKGFKKGSSSHTVHYLQRRQVHWCSHEGVCVCLSVLLIVQTKHSGSLTQPPLAVDFQLALTPFLPSFLQTIVAEHEIRNISCAAQDPDDLCTFAYITKDLKSGHHFCHVFSTVEVVSTFLHCKKMQKCGQSKQCLCILLNVTHHWLLLPSIMEKLSALWILLLKQHLAIDGHVFLD